MSSALELAKQLTGHFKNLVSEPTEFRKEISVTVSNANSITQILSYAKSELGFDMLLDVSSVDHLGSEPRFEIVYHLYSVQSHQYLRVKTFVGEETPELPTVSPIWKAADWHEREIFDMMGIRFAGHPDLRRILMWEGYPHHPLRKEFPLSGVRVDEVVKQAPMAGGPFVTSPGEKTTVDREPRGQGQSNSTV
jgi:NADH-quinone oxidoreductase subunit C